MLLNHEKVDFLHLPTPIEYLPRLSEELGIQLYIKRDDLTNLGVGGNKLRKLQYFLHDALENGYTMLLTVGGAQTNHGRLTAAVSAKYGLRCAICCVDHYPNEVSANILLDRIMGADVILEAPKEGLSEGKQLAELVARMKEKYEAKGEKVYYIPVGGSNELGILGYYECAMELTEQAKAMGLGDARVVSTVGSMGTYLGLFLGLKNEASNLKLTGVCISPWNDDPQEHVMKYYEKVKAFYGDALTCDVSPSDFDVTQDYTWGAYNNPVKEIRDTVCHVARTEAIILDPCYTGKTFYGLMDMVKTGKIAPGETVIFLHTGGLPGINTPFHRMGFEEDLIDGVTVL